MKIWKTSTADTKFNAMIVKKYGRCLRCGKKENLQCSHFWGKQRSSIRYYEDNCICLCYSCHFGNLEGWEYEKQGEYREFMLKKLGIKKYKELEKLAHTSITRKDAIKNLMELLIKVK